MRSPASSPAPEYTAAHCRYLKDCFFFGILKDFYNDVSLLVSLVAGGVLPVLDPVEEGVPVVQHPVAAGFSGGDAALAPTDVRKEQRQCRRRLPAHSGSISIHPSIHPSESTTCTDKYG